ncbi:MAG: hypothetical protein IJT91_00815 [Clostridia bacterium]|nr:hypothetical protein [Clostridia bacterium]
MKHLKMIVALVLALVTAFVVPIRSMAAGGKYVSEVYVAYGKNEAQARKTLQDKGFTPVEGNLSDGGDTYVMMGYKTTDNIRDAITDLAVMNMRGDFSVEEYKMFLKSQKTQITEFLNEFISVIREYRLNLKAGEKRAVFAHDLLNYYVDDDTGMKMGDLLNSETLQDRVGVMQSIEAENPDNLPDLVTLLLQGNAQVIKSIELILSMATDTADNTWIDRFAEMDYDDLLDQVEDERPDLNTETKRIQYLDNIYGETAAALGTAIAEIGQRLRDYEDMGVYIDWASDEELRLVFGDYDHDAEAALRKDQWFATGTICQILFAYEGGRFAKGELLEFVMGDIDPDDEEIFIPMAAALSEGQRYALPFVNPEALIRYAFIDDEGWEEAARKNVVSFDDLEEVSVYQNMDRDIFKDDGSIALTGAAQRANNTADGTTGTEDDKMDTFSKITAISWVASVTSLVSLYTVANIRNYLYNTHCFVPNDPLDPVVDEFNKPLKEIWFEHRDHEIYNDKVYKETMEIFDGIKKSNNGQLDPDSRAYVRRLNGARLTVTLTTILVVVAVVVSIASLVLTIIDLCRDKSVEQLPIPKYMVDNHTDTDGGSYTLNYKTVECNREEYFGADYKRQKGSSADLMADEGKQWVVLYASKNSKAGRPITPDFVVQKKNKAPGGYEGNVHLFGEKGAVNVVSGAFKIYSTFSQAWQTVAGDYSIYIFYKLSSDVKTYDEAAGNMTATTLSTGKAALFGVGGVALGAVLGAVVTILVKKKKKVEA